MDTPGVNKFLRGSGVLYTRLYSAMSYVYLCVLSALAPALINAEPKPTCPKGMAGVLMTYLNLVFTAL